MQNIHRDDNVGYDILEEKEGGPPRIDVLGHQPIAFFSGVRKCVFNRVFLMGVVGEPPFIKGGDAGNKMFASFPVSFISAGHAVCVEVKCWARLAEHVRRKVDKGVGVFVSGRLETSSWTDKVSGILKEKTVVVSEYITVLDEYRPSFGKVMFLADVLSPPKITDSVDPAFFGGVSLTVFIRRVYATKPREGGETTASMSKTTLLCLGGIAANAAKHITEGDIVLVEGRFAAEKVGSPDCAKKKTTVIVESLQQLNTNLFPAETLSLETTSDDSQAKFSPFL